MFTFKSLLPTCLLAIAPFFLLAQLETGMNTIGINGNLSNSRSFRGFAVNSNGDTTNFYRENNQYNVSISYLRFISDHLALGIGGGLGQGESINPSVSSTESVFRTNRNFMFNIQPQARYFIPLRDKLYLFVQGYVNLSYRTNFNSITDDGVETIQQENEFLQIGGGVDPGILFLIRKHWGIEAFIPGLSFSNNELGGEPQLENWWIQLNDNFRLSNIRLGWRFYF